MLPLCFFSVTTLEGRLCAHAAAATVEWAFNARTYENKSAENLLKLLRSTATSIWNKYNWTDRYTKDKHLFQKKKKLKQNCKAEERKQSDSGLLWRIKKFFQLFGESPNTFGHRIIHNNQKKYNYIVPLTLRPTTKVREKKIMENKNKFARVRCTLGICEWRRCPFR